MHDRQQGKKVDVLFQVREGYLTRPRFTYKFVWQRSTDPSKSPVDDGAADNLPCRNEPPAPGRFWVDKLVDARPTKIGAEIECCCVTTRRRRKEERKSVVRQILEGKKKDKGWTREKALTHGYNYSFPLVTALAQSRRIKG